MNPPCRPLRNALHSLTPRPYSTLQHQCSASSVPAAPLLVAQPPHALHRSTNSLPRTASTEEPDPLMSSIADPRLLPGTGAHLAPSGLTAIILCCVVIAGAFGVCCLFGASTLTSRWLSCGFSRFLFAPGRSCFSLLLGTIASGNDTDSTISPQLSLVLSFASSRASA